MRRGLAQILFCRRPPTKGVGLRVADSHTGNHREDDFTPLETIRRFSSIIWEKISFELEGETSEPERGVRSLFTFFFTMSAKDSIAIQTYELTQEEFNPFLTLYPILPEYGVMLPKSNQTIFDAPSGYVRLYTHSFSLLNLSSIVPAEYPQLLIEQNRWDSKSYKDKLPTNIEKNPMFQRLGIYPTSVCVFPDPILFLAGLQPSCEHGQQWPTIIVNGKGIYLLNALL
ncbi:hypothetical protein Tco_0755063 [Tanacetum coccineum]